MRGVVPNTPLAGAAADAAEADAKSRGHSAIIQQRGPRRAAAFALAAPVEYWASRDSIFRDTLINCFCQGPVLKARAKSPNALAQDGRGAGNCKSPYGVRHPGASGAFHSDGRLAGRQLFSLLQARVQGAPLRVSHLHRPASRVSDGALAPGFANNPFAADDTGTWTAQLTLPPQSCPCSAAATTGTCSCPHYRAAECGTASESSEMADGTRVTGGTRSVC